MPPRYPPPKKPGQFPPGFRMPNLPDLTPIVICAPSGGGKTTLVTRLVNDYPSYVAHSISHTTRPPRPNEVNGVDYHFVDDDTMQKIIDSDQLLEFATFAGKIYGTSRRTVDGILESGKICILTIDITGCEAIRKLYPAKFIFLKPPNKKVLEERLAARPGMLQEDMEARLRRAEDELEYAEQPGKFDMTIVNDNLDQCYVQLVNFIGNYLDLAKQKQMQAAILGRLSEIHKKQLAMREISKGSSRSNSSVQSEQKSTTSSTITDEEITYDD